MKLVAGREKYKFIEAFWGYIKFFITNANILINFIPRFDILSIHRIASFKNLHEMHYPPLSEAR